MQNDTRLNDGADLVTRSAGAPDERTIEHVTRMARATFGDEDKARRWLDRPTTALSGSRPLDASAEGSSGVQRVIDLLKRIDHGLSM